LRQELEKAKETLSGADRAKEEAKAALEEAQASFDEADKNYSEAKVQFERSQTRIDNAERAWHAANTDPSCVSESATKNRAQY